MPVIPVTPDIIDITFSTALDNNVLNAESGGNHYGQQENIRQFEEI
jgi:hypothetical protein